MIKGFGRSGYSTAPTLSSGTWFNLHRAGDRPPVEEPHFRLRVFLWAPVLYMIHNGYVLRSRLGSACGAHFMDYRFVHVPEPFSHE